MGVGIPASARFMAIARRCATVSGRRGRSLFPTLAPVLELHDEQAGRKLARSWPPPRTTGTM